MKYEEFDARLFALFQKHQSDETRLDDLLVSLLGALVFQHPLNSLVLMQGVDKVLHGPLHDLRRVFLEELRELLLELRRGQGH